MCSLRRVVEITGISCNLVKSAQPRYIGQVADHQNKDGPYHQNKDGPYLDSAQKR
jgi:hypothetical protein